MQTLAMFIGEFGCLFVYFFIRWRSPGKLKQRALKAEQDGKKPIRFLLVLIPASFDFMASAMSYIALNFIPGSVFQMLKGGSLITTAIFSYLLLEKKIKRNHLSGSALALIGIIIIGSSNIIFNDNGASQSDPTLTIIGTVLMVASFIFTGFFLTYENRLLNTYSIEPMLLGGIEGIFGIIYSLIFISIFTFVPCPFQDSSCVFNSAGDKFLERPQIYFKEIGNSTVLSLMVPFGLIALGSYYVNGLAITYHINALARSLLNITKTVVIWGIGIVVTVTAGQSNDMYKWEKINAWGIVLQSVGFLFLVVATLLYNENIRIPFLSEPIAPKIELENQSLLTEQTT